MIFEKQSPRTYTNIELGLHIKNCQYYSIVDLETVGYFFCTMSQSIGQILDTHVLIQLTKARIKGKQFQMINLNNGACVGELSVSDFYLSKSLTTSIEIIHQHSYTWEVLKTDKGFSLFTGKTWSKFYARLFNQIEGATFEWNYVKNQISTKRLEEIPVTGNANLTNSKNHFLLFVGMFLMEMELQMRAVD